MSTSTTKVNFGHYLGFRLDWGHVLTQPSNNTSCRVSNMTAPCVISQLLTYFSFPSFFLFLTMTLMLTSQYRVHGSDTRFERMAQVSNMKAFTDFTSRFLGKNQG